MSERSNRTSGRELGSMRDPINPFTHLHIYALTSHNQQPTKEYVRNYQQIMQNKPNFPAVKMSVSSVLAKHYENKSDPTLGENKPNSNPNKPNQAILSTACPACPERDRGERSRTGRMDPILQKPGNDRNHLFQKELRKSAPPEPSGSSSWPCARWQ